MVLQPRLNPRIARFYSGIETWLKNHFHERSISIRTITLNPSSLSFKLQIITNKNVLTAAVHLACLDITWRNEEAINSTRNRIHLLKVFYFPLHRRRYFIFVSELIQYACQRRPEKRLRSQPIRVYKNTKIQGPRFQRNYIIARDQKSDLHGTSFQSPPKLNRMLITRSFSYNGSLQHPTNAGFLINTTQ